MVKNKTYKKLWVEGEEDKRVIPELIKANGIPWTNNKKEPIVDIEVCGGDKKLIRKAREISVKLRGNNISSLGLIIDADDDPQAQWQRLRDAYKSIPDIDIPQQIPEDGLVRKTSLGKNFGIWIMPDNKISGMLETFLADLIPTEKEPLWDYAKEVVVEAKKRGAPFKQTYQDKACLYTWLAWQKQPGRQLHDAVKMKILDAKQPKVQIFVDWFKRLYDL